MRHRIHHRKLNRTSEHRKALLRNMAQNLIEHGQITTTLPKAKTLRPFFEKLLTLAVRARKYTAADDAAGALRARRALHKVLGDRSLIPKEHRDAYDGMSMAHRNKSVRMPNSRRYRTGQPKGRLSFTAESVTHRLIETIAPRFEDHPGGYTRLVRLPKRRIGDCAPLAVLQLIGEEEAPVSLTKPGKSARRRRADARYAMAGRTAKSWADKGRAADEQAAAKPEPQDVDEAESHTDSGADAENNGASEG